MIQQQLPAAAPERQFYLLLLHPRRQQSCSSERPWRSPLQLCPCAPLQSTLSASLLSSELRSTTRPAADLGQPILGAAASWSSSGRRGNCSVAWLHLGSTWLHNAQRTKGQKETQYIPASSTRTSKYMAAVEDHF